VRLYKQLIALTFCAQLAQAQTLNIVRVEGQRVMSFEETVSTYKCASRYFKKVGINFRVKFFKLTNSPCYLFHSLNKRSSELNCLSIFSSGRRKTLNYFLTEPFFEDNADGTQTAWLAGLAKLCGNTSTGNGAARSLINGQSSASRIEHSGAIMAHEVMHNMCATHYPDSVQQPSIANIMNPAATRFAEIYGCDIPVLRVTKRQVKRWYARNR